MYELAAHYSFVQTSGRANRTGLATNELHWFIHKVSSPSQKEICHLLSPTVSYCNGTQNQWLRGDEKGFDIHLSKQRRIGTLGDFHLNRVNADYSRPLCDLGGHLWDVSTSHDKRGWPMKGIPWNQYCQIWNIVDREVLVFEMRATCNYFSISAANTLLSVTSVLRILVRLLADASCSIGIGTGCIV